VLWLSGTSKHNLVRAAGVAAVVNSSLAALSRPDALDSCLKHPHKNKDDSYEYSGFTELCCLSKYGLQVLLGAPEQDRSSSSPDGPALQGLPSHPTLRYNISCYILDVGWRRQSLLRQHLRPYA